MAKPISLTVFLDFVARSGLQKLRAVQSWYANGDYAVERDVYKRVRESIVALSRDGAHPKVLDQTLVGVTDKNKLKHFPPIIDGYRVFHGSFYGASPVEWIAPPGGVWTRNGTSVSVNPELGLLMDGTLYVVKLYFKAEKLKANRVQIITHLMKQSLGNKLPEKAVVGVLDVRRAKLVVPTVSPDIDLQLDGEAAYWSAVAAQINATASSSS